MNLLKKSLKISLSLVLLLLISHSAFAQVQQGNACFTQAVGVTSAQCTAVGGTANNGTMVIGLSFNTNVCSTINTPTSWTKLNCVNFGPSSSAAIFYQTNQSPPANPNPTFTWTGSSTVTGNAIEVEGVPASSQIEVSNSNTGTTTTSFTSGSVTTATNLDHIVTWYFTDNGASGVTFTPSADLTGLMFSFNTTTYDSFVTEKRLKLAGSITPSGTASLSSNYMAETIAFKPLQAPVARTYGDVIPGVGTYTNINNFKDLGTIANNATAACGGQSPAISVCTFTAASGATNINITWATPPANQDLEIGMRQGGTSTTTGVTWPSNFFAYNATGQTYEAMSSNSDWQFVFDTSQQTIFTPTLKFWSDGTNLYLRGIAPRGDFNILSGRQIFTTVDGSSMAQTSITRLFVGTTVFGTGTPSISGGGALATGSNSFAGRITGLAATGNILTPGFTCNNAVTAIFQDNVTAGGVKVTAQSTTTVTFSATAADNADYIASCR